MKLVKVLALAGQQPGLVVLPTHRLLSGIDSALTLEEAETRWGDAFHVEYYPVWENAPAEQIDAFIQQLASSGRTAPSFGVYGLGQPDLFGILELRGRKPPPNALPSDRSDAWKSLDVALLHELLIDPLIAESGRPRDGAVLGAWLRGHERPGPRRRPRGEQGQPLRDVRRQGAAVQRGARAVRPPGRWRHHRCPGAARVRRGPGR